MRRKTQWARIDAQFLKNGKKLYPYKSMAQITKEMNKILEEMLYGTKK